MTSSILICIAFPLLHSFGDAGATAHTVELSRLCHTALFSKIITGSAVQQSFRLHIIETHADFYLNSAGLVPIHFVKIAQDSLARDVLQHQAMNLPCLDSNGSIPRHRIALDWCLEFVPPGPQKTKNCRKPFTRSAISSRCPFSTLLVLWLDMHQSQTI